jgi:hypothetical protein
VVCLRGSLDIEVDCDEQTETKLLATAESPAPIEQAGDFQAFLGVIHDHYRGWQLALLLDEDPSHTAEGSVELASGHNIELIWLPKRSPKLNPMDTLWGQGKDLLSANKQYATMDHQVDRFLSYLESLSGKEALQTAGVHSKHFWLKHALSKNFCGPA